MKVEMQLGSENLSIETGKSCQNKQMVRFGYNTVETVVLVAVVAERKESHLDFFPLTVDYREKSYAAGAHPWRLW